MKLTVICPATVALQHVGIQTVSPSNIQGIEGWLGHELLKLGAFVGLSAALTSAILLIRIRPMNSGYLTKFVWYGVDSAEDM